MSQFVQPLESRQLLAADLISAITSYSLPANVTAGSAIHGSATVLITNKGPSAVAKNAAKIEVNMVLRPGLTAGAASTAIGSKNFIAVASLAKGKSISVTIPLTIPASSKGGTFSLVAIADATNKIPEANENNNQGIAKTKYTIKAPLATLKVSAATANIKKAGVTGTGSVTLLNAGGIALTGKVNILFSAIPSDSTLPTLQIGSKNGVAVNLQRQQTLKVTGIALSAIAAPATTSAVVTYTIRATIVPHTTPTDANAADNILTAGAISIQGTLPVDTDPITAHGLNPQLAFAVGTTTTDPLFGYNTTVGTLTDAAGHTGTYSFQTPPIFGSIGRLTITFPAQTGITALNQSFNVTGTTLTSTIANPSGGTFTFSTVAASNADQLGISGSDTTFYLTPV
ncbi:MAG TPA: CARDB domain-containing protein [Tepidisphaeraceae bacterium]|jgi:hypothetical protein|nr:CARDB domain-containing protein [Tepidisphaeraceae bacterium]